MTILQAIENANTTAGIRNFRFANIAEFNSFMDSFKFEDYPMHVVEPFTTPGIWLNGRMKATIPLRGWILKRIPQDTVNYRSKQIEELHLAPMRAYAKAFIKAILSSEEADDIIDPEVEEVSFTIKPEYAFLPVQSFGVSYTLNLPIKESIC